jgi:predicted MFS family arabinose efflux permease
MLVSLVLWPLGTGMWSVVLISIPWGLGCFATNSAQQARLVELAPELASGSIAMNTSAMYAGQATGSALGAWLIYQGWLGALNWPAAAGTALALVASLVATRMPHRSKND